MSKNIVICCDGTGNEVSTDMTHVLKLYRLLKQDKNQVCYYDPGIGTLGSDGIWLRRWQNLKRFFFLATGTGLDENVLDAYRFLIDSYEPGDKVFLFGFSRGAYTVRVLAGFLHLVGLLKPEQRNLCHYALKAYKQSSAQNALDIAWRFQKATSTLAVPIRFMGVWDTVSSVLVPRAEGFLGLKFQTLPYTRTNSSIEVFRQAIAIDERRRMFRINRWHEPQDYKTNPFAKTSKPQDIKQVWFAGVHADIGGGYPEAESGLAKFPLRWMIQEAENEGLQIRRRLFNYMVLGQRQAGKDSGFSVPDVSAPQHDSLQGAWKILEYLPKQEKFKESLDRQGVLGWYLPQAEPRDMQPGVLVHQSVADRMKAMPAYRPINLPAHYTIVS